jgi:hypothetical protein
MNEKDILKNSRIKELDDIFYATKESQGTTNAIMAIKYVLFNDESVFEGRKKEDNKYLYISNTNNARKKAMLIQDDDLKHMLVKYCMQSFGLRGKDFLITDEELVKNRENIKNLEISAYEMIEQVAYIAISDIYLASEFLFENPKILHEVVDYMLTERYISEVKELLDNFNGIIDNNDISTDIRFAFYDAYCNIDDSFAELKRNDPNYIR